MEGAAQGPAGGAKALKVEADTRFNRHVDSKLGAVEHQMADLRAVHENREQIDKQYVDNRIENACNGLQDAMKSAIAGCAGYAALDTTHNQKNNPP